jgi:integrase
MTEHNHKRERRAANRVYFTPASVAKLKPKRKQYLAWDSWEAGRTRGDDPARRLAILVSPTGTKSFRAVFYYPGDSKPHWRHLGRVGVMTLDEARAATRDTQRMADRGEDPTGNDPRRSDKFKVCVLDYVAHEQKGSAGNKSAEATGRLMLALCKEWLTRPVASIRYAEIKGLLESIRDGDENKRPTPHMANRLYAHLKHFFATCARDKKITASPMTDMPRPWKGPKGRNRTWFAKDAADDAIKAIWKAADTIGGVEGQYLKALILTGKRPGPNVGIADMKWEHINADWFWDAPASGIKNKRRHAIHLPKRLQRVLHPRKQTGDVFTKISATKLQRRVQEMTGISDFIFHGIRHLVATKAAELKIPPHICDCCFDHVSKRGTGAVYDHHDYVDEMREAIELWGRYVEGLVDPGGKVQALR